MSDPLRHFDNLICIAEFVPMSDERKEMVRQAASEIARLRLTDEERADLEMWLAECLRQASTATEGANDELAERWTGRAKRAAAMIERLGGVE